MSEQLYCPYCGKTLPDSQALCCGEVGHGEPAQATAQGDSSRPLVNLPELRGSLDSSGPIVGDKPSLTADVPKERLIADRANVTGPASVASPSFGTVPAWLPPPTEVEEALNALEAWYERYGELFDLQPIAFEIANFLFPRG